VEHSPSHGTMSNLAPLMVTIDEKLITDS